VGDSVRLDPEHASVVDGALAEEAGAAINFFPDDTMAATEWGGEIGVRGAENGDGGHAEGGGEVHRTGIVRRDKVTATELIDEPSDRRLAGSVEARFIEEGGEFFTNASLGGTAVDGDADDEVGAPLAEQTHGPGITLDGVTFRIAILGPWTETEVDLAGGGGDRGGCRRNRESFLVADGRHAEGADEIEVAEGVVTRGGGGDLRHGELQEETPLVPGETGKAADAAETQLEGGTEGIREEESGLEGSVSPDGTAHGEGRKAFGKGNHRIDPITGLPERGEILPADDREMDSRKGPPQGAHGGHGHAGVAERIGRTDDPAGETEPVFFLRVR
jgi:hypothetical protein